MEALSQVVEHVAGNFGSLWPYLLLSIPLAVVARASGAAKYLRAALGARPWLAVLLATAVGAFSPFCSCSVVPVVASLLIAGVPLGPVMSFWVASPSMDPETFFLSVAAIGWELALWRLGATVVLALGAGALAHVLQTKGLLGAEVLRGKRQAGGGARVRAVLRSAVTSAAQVLRRPFAVARAYTPVLAAAAPAAAPAVAAPAVAAPASGGCGGGACSTTRSPEQKVAPAPAVPLWRQSAEAAWMVAKFMLLAFVIEALFVLFVPVEWVTGVVGAESRFAILNAALIGVPLYTSNLAALPLVGGLLSHGMEPAAALAFLVAGPTTTLPAMAAVFGLVNRRVFAVYLGVALVGAVLTGVAWTVVH